MVRAGFRRSFPTGTHVHCHRIGVGIGRHSFALPAAASSAAYHRPLLSPLCCGVYSVLLGPQDEAEVEGATALATLHVRMEPTAKAKAKRLGRGDKYVKVGGDW